MKTIQVNLYKFDELSDEAKQTAREWYTKDGIDYPFLQDAGESLKAFCSAFNVKIKDYSIGAFSHSWVKTDVNNSNFKGLKLKDVKRDNMPTGYYLDNDLWVTFYDTFKNTGNALGAFNDAIEAWIKALLSDVEYQYTDEAIDENLRINEYDFTEDGEVY